MLKIFFISFCLLVLGSSIAFSQEINLKYPPRISSSENLNSPNSLGRTDFRFTTKLLSNSSVKSINKGVHYTALFCKMENKVHKQLNIWVKLRAGNDDYRKLCGQQ